MNDAFITINAPGFAAQVECTKADVKAFLNLALPFIEKIGRRKLRGKSKLKGGP